MLKITTFLFIILNFSAFGQEAAVRSQQSPFMSFVPFILMFFVFYFLMIRPQKKKMDQEQAFVSALKKGDEVFTKSGMLGTISGINDKVVTLDIAEGTKVKFLRSQIAGSSKNIFSSEKK